MSQQETFHKKILSQKPDETKIRRIVGDNTKPAKSLLVPNAHDKINTLASAISNEGLADNFESMIFNEAEAVVVGWVETEIEKLITGQKLVDVDRPTFDRLTKELWTFVNDYKKSKEEYQKDEIWKIEYIENTLRSAYVNLGGLIFGVALALEFESGDKGAFNHLLKLLGIDLFDFLGGKELGGLVGKKVAEELGLASWHSWCLII